jgi:hypothetical protein
MASRTPKRAFKLPQEIRPTGVNGPQPTPNGPISAPQGLASATHGEFSASVNVPAPVGA